MYHMVKFFCSGRHEDGGTNLPSAILLYPNYWDFGIRLWVVRRSSVQIRQQERLVRWPLAAALGFERHKD